MLTVGDGLPMFRLSALIRVGGRADAPAIDHVGLYGKWLALLYWPKDFTLLSAAERDHLARIAAGFEDAETQFLAVTLTGDIGGQAKALGGLPFPVLADVDGKLGAGLGLDPERAGSVRATFIADPAGTIRWVSLSDLASRRSLREVAQVLLTLQGRQHPAEPAASDALIAMCAWCRRVRDREAWYEQEAYIRHRTGADFTHGICDDCVRDERFRS